MATFASEGCPAESVDSICDRRISSASTARATSRLACAAESAAPYALQLPWNRDTTTARSAASASLPGTGYFCASTSRE